jgi:MtN3 and saliva related transmembrane protein
MQASLPTLIGFLAGCLSTYSFVPQVVKCWRTGDAAAVSLRMFAIRSFGLVLWTGYGFVIGSLPVLIFSGIGLALSTTVMVLKVRSTRRENAGAVPAEQT